MQITIFSVWMTFVWCNIFIVLCYILRKRSVLLNLSSMTGIIILYLFCLIRLAVPVELPWTKVVSGGSLYNFLYQIFGCEITCVAGHEIYVYHIFVVALGTGAYPSKLCKCTFARCLRQRRPRRRWLFPAVGGAFFER